MAVDGEKVTPGGVSFIRANPISPESEDGFCLVLQTLDIKPQGHLGVKYTCNLNDGTETIRCMLPTELSQEFKGGALQDLGLIRIEDYTCTQLPNSGMVVILTKGQIVTKVLPHRLQGLSEGATLECGLRLIKREAGAQPEPLNPSAKRLKEGGAHSGTAPKADLPVKEEGGEEGRDVKPMAAAKGGAVGGGKGQSAAQILQDQDCRAAPAKRMSSSTRRVYPIEQLNPYQGSWTIKVRVTSKSTVRTYRNSRGEGKVFSVDFTDEDGGQIQATMFKEAADKFHDRLELGKVYYVSKGSLRMANKQYSTLKNEYEMTLPASAEVELVEEAESSIPLFKYNFTAIEGLGPFVSGRELVDIIGVVQSCSEVLSVRRKSTGDELSKREVTIFDQSQKTVVVTLWGKLAAEEGVLLSERAHEAPVVAITSLRVGDYQGVSLSATTRSMVAINPEVPEAKTLRTWHDSEGKNASTVAIGVGLPGGLGKSGNRSVYAERICMRDLTLPDVGSDKTVYHNALVYVTFVKPDQAMYYMACTACNRKVAGEAGSGSFYCEGCSKHYDTFRRRYIMSLKASDATGESWMTAFDDQAQQLLGMGADSLAELRDQDEKRYKGILLGPQWRPFVMRVSAAQQEYMNEKRQRITVRSLQAPDWAGEANHLLQQIEILLGKRPPLTV